MTNDKILTIAARVYRGLPITTEVLRNRYGCSRAGAIRVMRLLEDTLPVDVEVGERGKRTIRLRGHEPVRAKPTIATRWMQL
jgi:hypothetical protein